MEFIFGFVLLLVLASLIYYLSNPENHNSWNGGSSRGYKPKSRDGKIIHESLQAIGLVATWIMILGIAVVTVISLFSGN